ncbi:bifunctional 4-hydroxy-2-oxoglutarate aldolase/2-dehydro-3-deoxy-phosphogluconate aldolase [Anaerotruncus colihominis]|uniref:bifunctional 4-hydroxy-2-oxoglutarate aldolase/2-dehydro-3-deoxy-phosphogluconate aldolase n=1 Tax=Anaerotruncus colihominis TaxID=169435 RepID=UPI0034A199D0
MHECTKRLYAAGMLPVAVIGDARHAVPLCDALLAAGIDVLEVTFRTEAAAQAVAAIASERPGMLPGAGTILSVDQAEAAVRAGARFLVTPGFSPAVAAWCKNHEIPLYPGVSTATEVEQALAMGFTDLKFFPAEQSGGVGALRALGGPYQQARFIPTGGVGLHNLNAYLSLPNVLCCGGSFLVPAGLVEAGRFDEIETLCRAAVQTMFDPQLCHVGMNCAGAQEAEQRAKALDRLFGFAPRELPGAWFAGSAAELVKKPFLGAHGHLAIAVNHIERAMAWYQAHGVAFREEGLVMDGAGVVAVYLQEEVGGFAIHLRRRD